MLARGALVILSPGRFLVGSWLVRACCLAPLCQASFASSNTGGAWDNAKKCILAGGLVQTTPKILTCTRDCDRRHRRRSLERTFGPALNNCGIAAHWIPREVRFEWSGRYCVFSHQAKCGLRGLSFPSVFGFSRFVLSGIESNQALIWRGTS